MVETTEIKEMLLSLGCEVRESVLMRDYTTLRIGGRADLMVLPETSEMLIDVVEGLDSEGMPFIVLGGGSNVLVLDSGIREVVIRLDRLNRIDVIEQSTEEGLLYVQSGRRLQGLLYYLQSRGLSGLEGLTGIPGTVGGALVGNAGAYGYEMMEVVEAVKVIRKEGVEIIGREQIPYGYREGGLGDARVVLGALIRLQKDSPQRVKERMQQFALQKRQKQPITEHSAGCVFKNPPGQSAGRMIDEAGCKGMRRGDIEVSSVHANFFINKGRGTAEDFLALMDEVRERVFRRFSVELEPEIKIIGSSKKTKH
ncbi:MAG: UDP-N-acetylmuramate dehydrogenase [Nitrospirae bacterium]|nr:MAG: UDP-N-acetylmuramate dehydrogenase [Nitrospirota bacterium]